MFGSRSQRSPRRSYHVIECRIEPVVAAAATGDHLLGPAGVVNEVVALLSARIGMNARADIADLVGYLDQLRSARFLRRIEHLPALPFGLRQAHVVGALDDERCDTLGEF